jgi:nifR3 family TIM-barrel protein
MNVPYDILDLNLACPVYKVTRNNGGSSWLKDLNLLEDMIKEVVKKSSKPVSCKIRLGWDDSHINVDDVCRILQDNGVSLIAIHARTTKQGYTGKARYEELKNIRSILHIPFIISGDIFTADDAINAMEITGADAVMVARGGTGNPLLVKEINSRTAEILDWKVERSFAKQKEFLLEYATNLIEEKGEDRAIRLLRGIAPKFFSHFPFSKEIRSRICMTIRSFEDLKQILNEF